MCVCTAPHVNYLHVPLVHWCESARIEIVTRYLNLVYELFTHNSVVAHYHSTLVHIISPMPSSRNVVASRQCQKGYLARPRLRWRESERLREGIDVHRHSDRRRVTLALIVNWPIYADAALLQTGSMTYATVSYALGLPFICSQFHAILYSWQKTSLRYIRLYIMPCMCNKFAALQWNMFWIPITTRFWSRIHKYIFLIKIMHGNVITSPFVESKRIF